MGDALRQGRDAFERRSWGEAFAGLSLADREESLSPEDLERLATSAWMTGRDADADESWLRAHQGYVGLGDMPLAARCAFWQATCLLFRGDVPSAMGWIARGRRLLEGGGEDSVEQGWLSTLTGLPILFGGDPASAHPHLVQAIEVARRFGDDDLAVLARLGLGNVLIYQQRTGEAVGLLDEVMVFILVQQLSPIMVGIAYCYVIDMCQRVFELGRAREWTAALTRWCDSQPDLVPYRGNCLVHRCEIFQLQGAWHEALDAAQRACEWLAGPTQWDSLGSAYYQLGEIQRLRGEFAPAEDAYRKASQAGRDPEPGMSLLRLAQGRAGIAAAAIGRVLDEAEELFDRAKVLPAYVEIMLAAKRFEAARASASELETMSDVLSAPYLHALAAHATGAVQLAEGDARSALQQLRQAHAAWRDLDAPYQVARVREMIGLACRALDDEGSAQLEFDAARLVFDELGAVPDLARVSALAQTRAFAGGLTMRQLEVLELIASGKSNRAIASHLFISEKTVARHISNIFTKLGLSSRAEATAYAYKHGLA